MWNCDKRSGILLLWSVHSSGLLKESALLVIHADTKTLHIFFQVIGFENILLIAVMWYSLALSYDVLGVSIFCKCWIFHGVWSMMIWYSVVMVGKWWCDHEHIISPWLPTPLALSIASHRFQLFCNINRYCCIILDSTVTALCTLMLDQFTQIIHFIL